MQYYTHPRRRRPRRKSHAAAWGAFLLAAVLVAAVFTAFMLQRQPAAVPMQFSGTPVSAPAANVAPPGWVDVQLIDIDGASRRGEALDGVANIVVHYIGNPGTSAQQNHDYYTNPDSTVSSHFIVGLDGEVLQCIPLDEKSSASNWRNNDTISIEVCHPDDSGVFTQASYSALVRLTAWLCKNWGFSSQQVIRHYDVTGKECPRYFVAHEDEWQRFKSDVDAALPSA